MSVTPEYTQEFVDRGSDRIGLHIYPVPDRVPDPPLVVIWPAMGVPAGYYRRFAGALHRAGLAVVVADLRGTGASTPRPGRFSRYGYVDLVADVEAVQESLKLRVDGRRQILLGHSLGGQLALLHLALAEHTVDGLVLVAVGLPYWRTYPGNLRHLALPFTQGIGAATAVLGRWPGWGFGGRQARGVIRDWAFTARTGRFPRLNGVDVEAAVRAVRTPVLSVTVEGDRYVPHEVQEHLCAKLVAAPVRREYYRSAQAGARLDHFSWVRASQPLATWIAAFAADLPARPLP